MTKFSSAKSGLYRSKFVSQKKIRSSCPAFDLSDKDKYRQINHVAKLTFHSFEIMMDVI